MKTLYLILSGISIWALAVLVILVSPWFTIINNPELQANILLSLSLPFIIRLVAGLFFKKYPTAFGLLQGIVMLAVGICLDALVTVPYLVIPAGGTYSDFFLTPIFWVIVVEYLILVLWVSQSAYKRNTLKLQ